MEPEKMIRNFLDSAGHLTAFPAKRKLKLYALLYLTSQFESGRTYTEKEVNELIDQMITFHDPATLRRELYNYRFLGREANGMVYWLEEKQPTPAELGLEA